MVSLINFNCAAAVGVSLIFIIMFYHIPHF
jgi:hypothetical protein